MGKRGLSEQEEEEKKSCPINLDLFSLSFSVRVYRLSSCCPGFSVPFSAAENQPFYLGKEIE